jgi:hypothetical protein
VVTYINNDVYAAFLLIVLPSPPLFFLGTNTNLDFHLQGAPNFRVAELNVYGVAQPTVKYFFNDIR